MYTDGVTMVEWIVFWVYMVVAVPLSITGVVLYAWFRLKPPSDERYLKESASLILWAWSWPGVAFLVVAMRLMLDKPKKQTPAC